MRGQTNSLAGQVSCLEMHKDGSFGMRTLKYGIGFDEATPSNLVLVDKDLNTEDPALFPNFAIRFHIHIYQARPDVRCIVHTHPPGVNALGLAAKDLEADHMDSLGLFQQVAGRWGVIRLYGVFIREGGIDLVNIVTIFNPPIRIQLLSIHGPVFRSTY